MHGATPAFSLWFVYLLDICARSCTTVGAENKARVLFGPKTKTGPRAADLLVVGVLRRSAALSLALQQAQNVLLRRVGLCQHRGRRLLQDLVFGQICGFQSKVCILNAAFRSRQVG